jgi:hypothetical protein
MNEETRNFIRHKQIALDIKELVEHKLKHLL